MTEILLICNVLPLPALDFWKDEPDLGDYLQNHKEISKNS